MARQRARKIAPFWAAAVVCLVISLGGNGEVSSSSPSPSLSAEPSDRPASPHTPASGPSPSPPPPPASNTTSTSLPSSAQTPGSTPTAMLPAGQTTVLTPAGLGTSAALPSNAPPVIKPCVFTVNPVKFGLRVEVNRQVNFSVSLREQGGLLSHRERNQSTSSILHLKPCTRYEFNITIMEDPENRMSCAGLSNTTETLEIHEDDITVNLRTAEQLCFSSKWDLDLEPDPDQPQWLGTNREQCVTPSDDNFCSATTAKRFRNCRQLDIKLPGNLSVAYFLKRTDRFTPSGGFPVNITVALPPKCKDVNIDYTCVESEGETPKNLSELDPFTDYNCTANIQQHNVSIKNQSGIRLKIECDLKPTISTTNVANTSVILRWSVTSENCADILQNRTLFDYMYECTSEVSGQTDWIQRPAAGGEHRITGLDLYTHYDCSITAFFKGNKRWMQTTGIHTLAGTPDKPKELRTKLLEHNVVEVTCVWSDRFNGPHGKLHASLTYGKTSVALQNKSCHFEFKDLHYSTTYEVKVYASNSQFAGEADTKTVTTRYNDKAVIGFLVFLIILISVALLLLGYKFYVLRRKNSREMDGNINLIPRAYDEDNLQSVEPIDAEDLLEEYRRKYVDEQRLFLDEFQSIPKLFSRYSMKEAKKAFNTPKNRYVDILPYDHNRVQLSTGRGASGCDYINASFIDGYRESKKYIAAQGPKEETVTDFWRMVWEQQSSIIVMVTRCEEGNKVKCAQYWPGEDRGAEIFEEFVVKLSSENHFPDYTVRRLSLTNRKDNNSEREVTHIQFMSWPDHGIPEEPHLLLKLRRRVNAFNNFFSGPIVVHCSAGVGRTGTYISIDAMMESLEAENRVDIYGYTVRLRRQRCFMVQVETQYILIHQALLEHNQFGETEIPLAELHATLATLKQRSSSGEPTLMEEEFKRVPPFKKWRAQQAGMIEENRQKNRSSAAIPYDYNRVLLRPDDQRSQDSDADEDEEESSDEEDEGSSHYINASYINGYWCPHAFISTQTPLKDTVADFWWMTYQKKASAIVMLSGGSDEDKDSDAAYWRKEKTAFGDVEVEVTSTEAFPAFVRRNMLIRHTKRKEGRPVKHFQFLGWGRGDLPEKPQDLTDMIKEMKCGSGGGAPILVHCNDGSSRSGFFCALINLLDSAEAEKLVDVFQVAKTLRKERQGVIASLDQYQFLYEALDGVYPVQNGDVKAAPASDVDSVRIENEAEAAELPNADQQEEVESAPLVAVEEEGDPSRARESRSHSEPEEV